MKKASAYNHSSLKRPPVRAQSSQFSKPKKFVKDSEFYQTNQKVKINEIVNIDNCFPFSQLTINKDEFQIKKIIGDGHCLFRAILFELMKISLSNEEIQNLRLECAQYLKNYFEDFKDFTSNEFNLETYCKHLSKNLWGGNMELCIIANIKNINIRIYKCIRNIEDDYEFSFIYEYHPKIMTQNLQIIHLLRRNVNNEVGSDSYDVLAKVLNLYFIFKIMLTIKKLLKELENERIPAKEHNIDPLKDNDKEKIKTCSSVQGENIKESNSQLPNENQTFNEGKTTIKKNKEIKDSRENFNEQEINPKSLQKIEMQIMNDILNKKELKHIYPTLVYEDAYQILCGKNFPNRLIEIWNENKLSSHKIKKKREK